MTHSVEFEKAKHKYVVGFIFDNELLDYVYLIRKEHPEWQYGRLNGIGGRINYGETPLAAMCREGVEESGFEGEWNIYGYEYGINGDRETFGVAYFHAINNSPINPTTKTNEKIELHSTKDIIEEKHPTVHLVPMFLQGAIQNIISIHDFKMIIKIDFTK